MPPTPTGSSPRMRGKQTVSRFAGVRSRIIPAHAGQTRRIQGSSSTATDHPRACGANSQLGVPLPPVVGSSPRMRGKRVRARASATRARIIPAHAGQTHRMQRGFMAGPDHPRACGANVHTAYQLRFPAGSSPRMRGKRLHDRCHRQRGRIIPAHAGQTHALSWRRGHSADHPRACGANMYDNSRIHGLFGSSPRMRGKPHVVDDLDRGVRIIPAHAGQTVRFYAKTLERWTLNNWIRTVAPIFVLLFLPPVIGQNAYIERHYSNQSFSWFSKLHYASAFDLSLVA